MALLRAKRVSRVFFFRVLVAAAPCQGNARTESANRLGENRLPGSAHSPLAPLHRVSRTLLGSLRPATRLAQGQNGGPGRPSWGGISWGS